MTQVRNDTLGIKQTMRLQWLETALRQVLSGMSAQTIRAELRDRISEDQTNGAGAARGTTARDQIVSMVMAIWVTPSPAIQNLRDTCLELSLAHGERSIALHWTMAMAAYPFWFFIALTAGRVLSLQSRVRQDQIVARAKEHYGDRESVSRYARATIRSIVDWAVMRDTETRGWYSPAAVDQIYDERVVAALVEGILIASGRERMPVDDALASPALFPFRVPWMSAARLSQVHPRITSTQQALESAYVSLMGDG